MKRLCIAAVSLCFILALIETAYAFEVSGGGERIKREWTEGVPADHAAVIPQEIRAAHFNASAQVDTYTIVHYDFEDMDWQGWTKIDNTRRYEKCFFHVDDFADLPAWSPLEGAKSMWCGTRPGASDPYLCSWVSAPGYGNNWSQSFVSDRFDLDGGHFTLSFRCRFDTEPVYDWISIDYDQGGG